MIHRCHPVHSYLGCFSAGQDLHDPLVARSRNAALDRSRPRLLHQLTYCSINLHIAPTHPLHNLTYCLIGRDSARDIGFAVTFLIVFAVFHFAMIYEGLFDAYVVLDNGIAHTRQFHFLSRSLHVVHSVCRWARMCTPCAAQCTAGS